MNRDQVVGKKKQVEGRIREDVGKLTDNPSEQIKGKVKQVEGKIQEEIGNVKKKLD